MAGGEDTVTGFVDDETGPIQVVHVDESSEFGDVSETVLERESDCLSVETVTSVAAARDRLTTDRVDCVVCEYDMPETDGLSFYETVQEEYGDIPFILFTGEGSETVASQAVSAGVTDYLSKDAGTDQFAVLANRIENAVDAHRSRRVAEQNKRQLETLIQNLPGMVYRCRNERDWPMEFVAGECEPLCGHTAEELESGEVVWGTDILYPDDTERLWETVQSALDAGEPFEVTYRFITREGDLRWAWERGRGIYSDGEVVALEGFITDITERRKRAQALESLHESTGDLLARDSAEEIAEVTTQALVELLDLPNAGVYFYEEETDLLEPATWTGPVERTLDEIPTLGEGTMTWEAYCSGEPHVCDSIGDGKPDDQRLTRYESCLAVPIGDHGVALAASTEPGAFDTDDRQLVELLCANVASALDRLEREKDLRERERQLERENERLDRFVSLASHDLRNPLDAAQLRLELAQRECDSDHLAVVERSHDRMEELLSDLLSLARTGETVSDVDSVHLGNVVRRCWGTVDTTDASLDIDADTTILAAESRLSELFENLLRNAIEHGSPNAGSQTRQDDAVTVTIGTLPDGFYVADDGTGIPEEEREEVFEEGYSTDDRSTGFGLSIVREIVQAHSWSISLTESEDGGARFEIRDVETPD